MRQTVINENWSESVNVVPPIATIYDAAASDSDKSWVVPTNQMWKLNYVYVVYVSSATAGTRTPSISVLNELGQTVGVFTHGTNAASENKKYVFMQSVARSATFVNNEIQTPFPMDFWLQPGWTLQISDTAAIAPTEDNMTVAFQYEKYTV